MSKHFGKALILETNNLRGGGAGAERAARSLEALLRHLGDQTLPLSALDEVVVTHDGLSPNLRKDLDRAAGRDLCFVEIPEGADYYEAKNRGFAATRAEVVVFGDSDCWPEPRWLEALLEPFGDEGTRAVAGRTTYREDLLGTAATTIDFMYFDSPLGAGCTRNFYANNVAFRRELFADHPFPLHDGLYRGPCQILGLKLHAAGVPIRFAPAARTFHRFPDDRAELVRLRSFRGQDARTLAPVLAEHLLPAGLRWLGKAGPLSAAALLACRLGFSLRALNRQGMPELSGARLAATVAGVAALSALDAAAALGAPWLVKRAELAASSRATLSYHADADAFVAPCEAAERSLT